MRRRRDVLATAGVGLVALAGCTRSGAAPSTSTDSTTGATSTSTATTPGDPITEPQRFPWGETATVDGTHVTPEMVTVQRSAFYLATPDTIGVLSFDDRAVFATVTVDGEARPDPRDFALALDDRVGGWVDYEAVSGSRFNSLGVPYTAGDDDAGWVAFEVADAEAVENPRLRVQLGREENGAVRWPLPDDAVAALQSPPPEFHVSELSAPDSVPRDDPIEVAATVANRGDGAGTFRAAFNELGPMYAPEPVEFDLEPGEFRAWTGTISSHVGDEHVDGVQFDFRSPAATYEREVEVVDA